MATFKGRGDFGHKTRHFFFHLGVRLEADVEVQNHLVEAGGFAPSPASR